MPASGTRRWTALLLLLAAIGLLPLRSADVPSVSIPAAQLIQFLNQAIGLYRQSTIQEKAATEPDNQGLLYDNAQIAGQVVQFAFVFARAQESVKESEPSESPAASGTTTQQSSALARMLANLDKDIQSTQAEQNADRKKLATATGARSTMLQSQISELQGEIALAKTRRDAVRNLLEFVSGAGTDEMSGSDLKAQIDALAASVPEINSNTAGAAQASALPPAQLAAAAPAQRGIWNLAGDLFSLSSQLRTVNAMAGQTHAFLKTSAEVRAPFLAQLRTLSKQGDQIAAQADTADPAQLAQEKQQLDALATEFKQLAAAVAPLGKQNVLLGLYQKNLDTWRGNLQSRYRSDLRSLGIRLGMLALLIGVIFGLSELWRRAVYRYVHDMRRRYQFLLLRRLTLWFVIALIIVILLAGRLSSFATFAGLLTAGVAVALQNVILSVVGYFFLIGKFGIRVGDRVEISGTTGEVIDIGLVRFHLMELGQGAAPTGRVVAFANSVVFQAAAGLFRQFPGVSLAWHQVTVTVPHDADLASIRNKLLEAVEKGLRDYQKQIERVYAEMDKRGILFSERGLQPRLEPHLTAAGIEVMIRYPVDLQHATEIDAGVSHELHSAVEHDAKLQVAGEPQIQLK